MHLVHRGGNARGGGIALSVPTDEPVNSFGDLASGDVPKDPSWMFGAIDGVTSKGSGHAALMVKEGPIRGQGPREHVTGGLA